MLLATEETEAQRTLRLDSSEQAQRRKFLSFLGNFEFKEEWQPLAQAASMDVDPDSPVATFCPVCLSFPFSLHSRLQ